MKNERILRRLSKYFENFADDRSKRREMHRKIHIEYHQKVNELQRHYRDHNDFQRFRRHVRYTRPLIALFNLVIWFLIFRFLGIKVLSVIFALILSIGGLFEIYFLASLERRIFKPINKLRNGVEEVAKGNYDVCVESDFNNEIAVLIESFNEMTKKLKESEELKLQYEENRKSLIANISHDLKTPITSIQGYIETMQDRKDLPKETVEKYHQIIYSNATYMNKLIDDLFLFSKLDMQKLEFNFEDISVRAFMNDLMEEFQLELEDSNVKFEYLGEIANELEVKIDRKRIYQVFKNIIGNALKYGGDEDLKIKVRLYENNKFVFIDIENNGPGIPEDSLPYIFDRFYRVDYARTKNLMSTGLGLAISKELIEAHGGEIRASSKVKDGTCFTIKLPIYEETKGK